MAHVLGIDLGTTRSVMAIMEQGRPVVLSNAVGNLTTPSVVALTSDGRWLVGEPAVRQSLQNPRNTVRSIKRFMGRRFDDPEVERDRRLVSYEVVRAPNGDAWIELQGGQYSPPQISAMILRKLKADAEAILGEVITQAVITVPAYFGHAQHRATFEAGRLADLEILRILNEPTAAALAYGLDKRPNGRVAVYDLGGGTFDISILELGEGVFEVTAISGDAHLGGYDFDQRLITWLADEFERETGVDPRRDKMALLRLQEAAEKAKVELSTALQAEIYLPFIAADASGPLHLHMRISRHHFESMVGDLLDRSRYPVQHALQDAGVKASNITEVVLAGGMTRMPAVRAQVKQIFDKEPTGKLNPDEAVAIGAAFQAGILKGQVRDTLLLDAISHSLGIETLGGVMTRMIERNTTIPTRKSQVLSTSADGQTSLDIHILQGEQSKAKDNTSLALIRLDGITASPKGVPHVDVTCEVDVNGNIRIKVRDQGTGHEERVIITGVDRSTRVPRPGAMPTIWHVDRPGVSSAPRANSGDEKQAPTSTASPQTKQPEEPSPPPSESRSSVATPETPESPDTSETPGSPESPVLPVLPVLPEAPEVLEVLEAPALLEAPEPSGDVSEEPAAIRVFVSHCQSDHEYCQEFIEELRLLGADVWYDQHNMPTGMPLDEIQTQVSVRPIFLVILSPTALHRSPWVKMECTWAFEKWLHEQERTILPVTGGPITKHDLGDTWMFISTFWRIEAPNLQPYPPREAARRAFDALQKKQ